MFQTDIPYSYHKLYYINNKGKWIKYNAKRYEDHGDAIATYYAEWRKKNKDKTREYGKRNYMKHIDVQKSKHREYTRKLKQLVLAHYGNGEIKCVLCGFDNIDALTIDHINGNGSKHRKEIGGGGVKTYLWLRKNNFPEGFRTLCSNCQLIEYAKQTQIRYSPTGGSA